MNKNDVVYTHNRILFGHEKGRYPAICDNMDGLRAPRLCKVSQTENDKYYMILLYIEPKSIKPAKRKKKGVKQWLPGDGDWG